MSAEPLNAREREVARWGYAKHMKEGNGRYSLGFPEEMALQAIPEPPPVPRVLVIPEHQYRVVCGKIEYRPSAHREWRPSPLNELLRNPNEPAP
jgi:hypothetical protein